MFSDYNGINLDINNKPVLKRFPQISKHLETEWHMYKQSIGQRGILREIKKKKKTFNGMKINITAYENSWDTCKVKQS